MNCEEFSHIIDDFIGGNLKEERRNACERHLSGCAECARLAAIARSVHESLHDVPRVNAPAGLADRILAAVEAEDVSRKVIEFPGSTHSGQGIDCHGFDKHAAAYVDGLLDADLVAAMDDHRASCRSCGRLYLAHKAVAAAFSDVATVKAPTGMPARILAAATGTVPSGVFTGSRQFRRFASQIAAASIFITVAAMLMIVYGVRLMDSGALGAFAFFDSLMTNVTTLPLLFKAWCAAQITPDQWVLLEFLATPVSLPYVSFELPAYLVGLLLFSGAGLLLAYRMIECRLSPYERMCL